MDALNTAVGVRKVSFGSMSFCSIVVEDRSSRDAMDSEEWVMLILRQQKYGEPAQNNTENTDDENRIHDSETSLERTVQVVIAFIEL